MDPRMEKNKRLFPRNPPPPYPTSSNNQNIKSLHPKPMKLAKANITSLQSIQEVTTGIRYLETETCIKLLSNYFPITLHKNLDFYKYQVIFNPEENNTTVQMQLINQHVEKLGVYIFNEEMLYSNKKYDLEEFQLLSKRRPDNQLITITITFISVIETNDPTRIRMINLLLHDSLGHLGLRLMNKNFYDLEAKIFFDQHKIQIWPGYEASVGLFDDGLLLRIDIKSIIIREETVIDYFDKCVKDKALNGMDKFRVGIVGTIVLTKYNNKTYRVYDIDENSNIYTKFRRYGISIVDYYQQKWGLTLSRTNQPLLISKRINNFFMKSNTKCEDVVYLVPELCYLTDLTESMRNNVALNNALSIHTQVNPKERINKYNSFITRLNTAPKSLEIFKNWNLTLSNKLIEINGRVLPSESICFGHSILNAGPQSTWKDHLKISEMYNCHIVKTWIIIAPSTYFNKTQQFANDLIMLLKRISYNLPNPILYFLSDNTVNTYLNDIDKVINEQNPGLLLCVIESEHDNLYNSINRKLCVDKAVPCQIVLLKNILKSNYCVNTKMLMSINCKLGGAPWCINIPIKDLMVVGLSISHDKENKNLYGALVATMNNTQTAFYNHVEQYITEQDLPRLFATSMILALINYKEKNKRFPESIVVYRNLIEDEQLSYVHKEEMRLIKNDCEQLYKEQPSLTFIMVNQYNDTQFFPNNCLHTQDLLPGTVVDKKITNPNRYEFFLVSQITESNVETPVHYDVIYDTMKNWSPNQMQSLTYKLTHLYYDYLGTVKVPAVCLLANKLACFTANTLKTTPNPVLENQLFFL